MTMYIFYTLLLVCLKPCVNMLNKLFLLSSEVYSSCTILYKRYVIRINQVTQISVTKSFILKYFSITVSWLYPSIHPHDSLTEKIYPALANNVASAKTIMFYNISSAKPKQM